MTDNNFAGASGFARPTWRDKLRELVTPSATRLARTMISGLQVEGVDISHWQGDVDFEKMASKGVKFVFIRAGSANANGVYRDSRFDEYMQGAKAAGIYRGCYWYFKPAYHQRLQGEYFAEIYKDNDAEIFPVLDVEDYGGLSPSTLRNHTLWVLGIVKDLCGDCGVYTAPYWWRDRVARDARFAQYPLWIAHWGVSAPTLPPDWTEYYFWQTHVGSDGPDYGVSSQGLDHNLYNGTEAEFYRMFGGEPPVPGPCPQIDKVVVHWDDGVEQEFWP